MSKKSFIIHIDSLDILDDMSDEQAGQLLKAIHKYQKGEEIILDFGLKMAFAPFKNQFIRDDEKYNQYVEKQAENGSKGGRPSHNKENQKTQAFLNKPNKPFSVSDSVNDSKNINENNKEEKKALSNFRFIKPSLSEISEYCILRKNNVSPETFFDFYESKGWMVGSNKMKDWKACIRTWESKNNLTKPVEQELYQGHDYAYFKTLYSGYNENQIPKGTLEFMKKYRDAKA